MIRDFSNPKLYNKKYIPLLQNDKRYIIMMWWAGSWKSRFEAQKEIIKTYNEWNKLLAVRKVKRTIKDSMYNELLTVIKERWLEGDFKWTKSPLEIKNKITGSNILFFGMDDPEKVKSVSNPTRVWIEEATELTKADFDQLDLRLRWESDLQITCTFNPISAEHRLIKEFRNHGDTEDVECLHSTYKDNRFVWHDRYEKVMQRLKEQDENMYKIYALWEPWQAVDGLIFDYTTIENIPEQARLKGYWLDFWYNDPSALIAIYEYNNDLILDEVIYQSQMTNQELCKLMKDKGVDDYVDIVWDNARPEAIEEIYKTGFNIYPCKKWKDSIVNGIQLMKQFNLRVTSHSSNLIKEFNNYTWAKDKKGDPLDKPIDLFNHGIDASRYGISSFFTKDEEIELFVG